MPNTYRNNLSSRHYGGNGDVINNYTLGERKLSSVSNGYRNNTTIYNTRTDQQDATLTTSQCPTNTNDASTNYNLSSPIQYLGLPDTSTPYYRQSRQLTPSPVRTPSPNIFETREFGGTVEDIKTRFTSSPLRCQNTSSQQQYPLLQNLNEVNESEVRRNKKG